MPTAYSYIRFSSVQQSHGVSFERQQDMVSRWLLAHPEYSLAGASFQDLGISGFSGEHLNNGFGKLLATVESGVIKAGDVVLIEAIDRAGRLEPLEMLPLLSRIVNAGVSIVTLDDGITYNRESVNSNHLFLLVAKVQQAYQYSDALSRRIKDVYQRKREKAATGAGVNRRTPVWLTTDGKLIESVAPFIVQAFEDYSCGIGERRIHHRIYDKHPLLNKLSPGTVKKWFRNSTAIGRWNDIEDVYPAVVSRELFYRVQKRLEATYKPKGAAQKYLLTGLVFCGVCGNTMGVQSFGERSPTVMQCMTRKRLGNLGCENNKSIPYHVLDYIRATTSHSALQRAVATQTLTHSEKRIIEIEGELKELHVQSERVVEQLAEYGGIPAIKTKLQTIATAIEKLELERISIPTLTAELEDVIDFENSLINEDDDLKLNALLKGAEYRIVCDKENIHVNEASYGQGNRQEYVYRGVHRPTDCYVLDCGNGIVKLPLPRDGENEEEYILISEEQLTAMLSNVAH